MNKVKIISAIFAAALVINFIMLVFVRGYFVWFWIVIAVAGLFAYKVLPRFKK